MVTHRVSLTSLVPQLMIFPDLRPAVGRIISRFRGMGRESASPTLLDLALRVEPDRCVTRAGMWLASALKTRVAAAEFSECLVLAPRPELGPGRNGMPQCDVVRFDWPALESEAMRCPSAYFDACARRIRKSGGVLMSAAGIPVPPSVASTMALGYGGGAALLNTYCASAGNQTIRALPEETPGR